MKIDKYFLYILLFLSLIAVLFFFNLGQERLNKIKYLKDKEFILKRRIKSQISLHREEMKLENIDNFNDSIYNSLRRRVNKGNTLVMLISQKQCQECIIQEYKKLEKLPQSAQSNIVILLNYKKYRDLRVFLSYNKFDYPIYNSVNPIFDELKNSKDPIFFTLDSTLIPQHIFMPISFMPDLTDEYLDFIITEFFEKKEHVNKELAKVIIRKDTHDFGELNIGESVETEFELQNKSLIPLLIKDVKASCGCVVTSWDKKPISEGKKTFIRIQFNPQNTGFFKKSICIFSNASTSPHILTVKGEINK